MQAPAPSPTPAPSPRRRWLRRCLIAGGVLLALFLAALPFVPWVIEAIAPGILIARIQEATGAQASIEAVRFSWSGDCELIGLRVHDAASEATLDVPRITAKVALFSALTGDYHADVAARDVVVHASVGADGRLRLPELPKKMREHAAAGERSEPGAGRTARASGDSAPALPPFSGSVTIENLRVAIARPGGADETSLVVDASASRPDSSAPVEFRARTSGAARTSLEGTFDLASGAGAAGLGALQAQARYRLEPLDLTSLPREVLALAPVELQSGSVSGAGEIAVRGERDLDAKGTLEISGLRVRKPGERPAEIDLERASVEFSAATALGGDGAVSAELTIACSSKTLGDLDLDLGVSLAPGAEEIDVRKGRYRGRGATVDMHGRLRGFADPSGELTFDGTGDLGALARDFRALLPARLERLAGKFSSSARVTGGQKGLRSEGSTKLTGFSLALAAEQGKPPIAWDEAALSLSHTIAIDPPARTVRVESLRIESGLIEGGLSGTIVAAPAATPGAPAGTALIESLRGEFTFDAARVEALLGARIPAGIRTSGRGRVQGELAGDKLIAKSTLEVNGGPVESDVALDLRPAPEAACSLAVRASGVGASAEIVQLLAMLHPIFAIAEDRVDGLINGKVNCAVKLAQAAALDLAQLRAGWEKYPKHLLAGEGSVEMREFQVHGTELLEKLLVIAGLAKGESIDLKPLEFVLRDGRVQYARPMRMKIRGHETSWTGSVGLDQSLDLAWEVPITEAMRSRYKALSFVTEDKLSLAVRGTAKAPVIAWDELLAGLTGKVAKEETGKLIEKGIEKGMEGLLGSEEDNRKAEEIFARANKLYEEGNRAEAAKLYRELRDDYRKTLTYKLHKGRIKERAEAN